MPVRSLNSSIAKWPSRREVHTAFSQWVARWIEAVPAAVAAGYFGSYARDEAGAGSDLDVIIIVAACEVPFEYRYGCWDFSSIPVPVEAQIYTVDEWRQLSAGQPRFYQTLVRETCWLLGETGKGSNIDGCTRR